MQRITLGIYELTPMEGCRLTIDAVGTGFQVIAALDSTGISIKPAVPTVITAAMLSGTNAYHRVNIHPFFTQGSSKTAAYTIEIADDNSVVIDTITVAIDTTQTLPYAAYQPIVLWIQ